MFNALSRSLAVDGKTVLPYFDLLVDLMLVRKLQPFQANIGKRLVKSPRVFVCDSGIVHALLNIGDYEAFLGHPLAGPSWEGFVTENLPAATPPRTAGRFTGQRQVRKVDLLLEIPGHGYGPSISSADSRRALRKASITACEDLKPSAALL